MKLVGNLLGYECYLIENEEDCEDLIKSSPSSIGYFAFDTNVVSIPNIGELIIL